MSKRQDKKRRREAAIARGEIIVTPGRYAPDSFGLAITRAFVDDVDLWAQKKLAPPEGEASK